MADSQSDFRLDPLEVPGEYVHGVGMVATSYSLVEMMLENTIIELAGIESERGQAMTTHMTTPLRLSVFRSLSDLVLRKRPELVREANDLALEIQRVSALRASIVHAVWFFDPSDETVHAGTATARKVLKKSLDQKSIEEIQLVVNEITRLIARLTRFGVLAFGWRGELPSGHTEDEIPRIIAGYASQLRAEQDSARKK